MKLSVVLPSAVINDTVLTAVNDTVLTAVNDTVPAQLLLLAHFHLIVLSFSFFIFFPKTATAELYSFTV